jgi:hypothetical protein
MLGLKVQIQCLLELELLLTMATFEWQISLMPLHMIVHCILLLLCNLASWANKLSLLILTILKHHCTWEIAG